MRWITQTPLVRRVLLVLAMAASSALSAQATVEIDNAALANAADGRNWAAWGRNFNEQRFSPLEQINTQTVNRLGLAWSLELDDVWNVSSQPLAVDGVLYFAVGYSVVHAVDAKTGKLLWKYDPKVSSQKMRMAWGIRGLAYWKGRVYTGVQDGRLFALDAKTGALVWETLTTQPGDSAFTRMPSGPHSRARPFVRLLIAPLAAT